MNITKTLFNMSKGFIKAGGELDSKAKTEQTWKRWTRYSFWQKFHIGEVCEWISRNRKKRIQNIECNNQNRTSTVWYCMKSFNYKMKARKMETYWWLIWNCQPKKEIDKKKQWRRIAWMCNFYLPYVYNDSNVLLCHWIDRAPCCCRIDFRVPSACAPLYMLRFFSVSLYHVLHSKRGNLRLPKRKRE